MGRDARRRLVGRRGLGEYCRRHRSRVVLSAIGDSRSIRRVDHDDHNIFHDDDHYCTVFHDDDNRFLHDHDCALFHHDNDCFVHDDHNRSLHDHHHDPVSRPRY